MKTPDTHARVELSSLVPVRLGPVWHGACNADAYAHVISGDGEGEVTLLRVYGGSEERAKDGAEQIIHALNSHARLTEQNAALNAEIKACHKQFDRICSTLPPKVGGYSAEECIDSALAAQKQNAALVKAMEAIAEQDGCGQTHGERDEWTEANAFVKCREIARAALAQHRTP